MPIAPPSGTAGAPDAVSPPYAAVDGDDITQPFRFSFGNPSVEETRRVIGLYYDSNHNLPVGRKPLVCVLGVPNRLTYAVFYQFCSSLVQHVLHMRIVRIDGMQDQYSILIRFDSQKATDNFYFHFNEKRFPSLEGDVCCVRYIKAPIEHAQTSLASSTEQLCTVCFERLDQDRRGILTTICNHSFHCSCISKWADSSCPVCRYCQQQPEKSTCSVCSTSWNLWTCLICGFVGCGRDKEGHSKEGHFVRHWKETQHRYSLELKTQLVWDYSRDNYVHLLIQSEIKGKLVELNLHCSHADDGCESCGSGISEAFLNKRVDDIIKSYSELLATLLGNQWKINENLMKNQEILVKKILDIEERVRSDLRLRERIHDLEKQLGDLRACLEGQKTLEREPDSIEISGDVASPELGESSWRSSKKSFLKKTKKA